MTSTNKVILAPFCYVWSSNNSSYKIPDFKTASALGVKNAVAAFLISNGSTGIWDAFLQSIPDMKQFIDQGNNLAISVGGANGPFLQNTQTQVQIVSNLTFVLNKTGCRHLDFDIEGASITETDNLDKLNKAIVQLQNQFPNLIVSYTLPVAQPRWGSITQDGLNLIKNAINNGVKNIKITGMLMDIYLQGIDWSTMAINIMENIKSQITPLFPQKSDSELYNMLSGCPMTGVQDDQSIFSVSDAKILAKYAVEKGLYSINYWALQRDQIGSGSLAIYNGTNKSSYEYYNAFASILGYPLLGSPQPQPQPTPQPQPIPIPQPNQDKDIIIGNMFNGNVFVQDTNPDWIKINNTALGDTFNYKSVKGDISKLLKNVDNKTAIIIYHWKSKTAYIKTNYNLSNVKDSKTKTEFTSFILKSKIHSKSTPTPTNLWKTNTTYNIGSNTMYNGTNYECTMTHLSSLPCAPGISVWTLKNPVPVPIPTPIPQPIPEPVGVTMWASDITYSIGSIVRYEGNTYKCLIPHTSIISWAPGIWTGALWLLI